MNYIQQAYKGHPDFWRYIIGSVIAIIGVGIFSMPHMIAIFAKKMNGEVDLAQLSDINYLLTLFESNENLVYLLLPFAGGLLFLLLAVKFLHKQSFVSLTTARQKIDWKRVFSMFFVWGILSSSLVLVDYYMAPEGYQWNFQPQKFAILAVIAIILVPLQTSFEEYAFRGYLMQGLGVLAKNRWVPLVLTSVCFGLLHISNPEIEKLGYILLVYYIGTGFFLAIMTLMDEGLELALGFHAANNLFTALLVTADWTAFQTYSIFKDVSEPEAAGFFDIFLPVFIIFPIILLVLGKIYGWKNWKDKLFGPIVEPPKEDYKVLD
ncbi:CPBP family intramembrane metalloprotease [Winogradskyella maritima]|uniref:CPBP family intramembrane glutamic endopeptidase n=1 Tax=Winogradskyella maritima TaxID=1517766 RepID=A0ABV8AIC4_9FLAO|nr:CPBP family intramembrane metalloprotease [Winogradskyella maritima]